MTSSLSLWIGFIVFVLLMLALDLGVFHRQARVVTAREALGWTSVWVFLSLLFNVAIFFIYESHWLGMGINGDMVVGGYQAALEYFTGYLIEKSLSLDNIFIIALIFSYFRVPGAYQHRVLFWGVIGAVVMRGLMIGLGVALISRFGWIIDYIFGSLLLIASVKMLISSENDFEPEKSIPLRLARRFFRMTNEYHGSRFTAQIAGKTAFTPLFVVLLLVETSDVFFAVDSVPAIFAITRDPFLVFTSNIFAILGLRSLYFVLAALVSHFVYLRISLVFLLAFVAIKMLLHHHFPIPTLVSLAILLGILGVGIAASLITQSRSS